MSAPISDPALDTYQTPYVAATTLLLLPTRLQLLPLKNSSRRSKQPVLQSLESLCFQGDGQAFLGFGESLPCFHELEQPAQS